MASACHCFYVAKKAFIVKTRGCQPHVDLVPSYVSAKVLQVMGLRPQAKHFQTFPGTTEGQVLPALEVQVDVAAHILQQGLKVNLKHLLLRL